MPIHIKESEMDKSDLNSRSGFHSLTVDLDKNMKQFSSSIESLVQNYKSDPESLEFSKGISFLSMKNMLIVEYLTNLIQLIYLKINGQKISGNSCVQRLAEIRCVRKFQNLNILFRKVNLSTLKINKGTRKDENNRV